MSLTKKDVKILFPDRPMIYVSRLVELKKELKKKLDNAPECPNCLGSELRKVQQKPSKCKDINFVQLIVDGVFPDEVLKCL